MATTNDDSDVTRLYEEINTGNVYRYVLNNGTITREFIRLNSVPLLAKIDIKANTVITADYVVQSDAVVTNDARLEEYNMIVLPVDLITDDYVDIRLMLPSGQNFIVVSKAQVEIPQNEDGTYVSDTIRVQLTESEIMLMSSAIVEAYGIEGAYLYANKYVEPGLQDSATTTYYPNNAIIAQINANPNIVTTARNELSNRLTEAARQVRQNNLQPIIDGNEDYSTSVQEGMTEGTARSQESRVNYLDLLTAQ